MKILTSLSAVLLICVCAQAQDYLPRRSGFILLGDRAGDQIWALNDFNFDFSTEGAGECVPWYTGANGPAIATIQDITVSQDGRVFVADSSNSQVVWLLNNNLDGDADDAGEAGVFFDASNQSAVQFGSILGISMQAGSPVSMYLAVSGNGSFSADRIIKLVDVNDNGDANDAGDATVVWENQVAIAAGNPDIAIPSSVLANASGRLFVLQATNTGASGGVYALDDLNGDLDFNDAGEVTPYFILPGSVAAAFDMTLGRDGRIWVADRGTPDTIYVLEDLNNDGDVADPNEARVYWTPTLTSLIDNIGEIVLHDGSTALLVAEDGGDDRVLLLYDLNGNGIIDTAAETITLHNTANPGAVDFGQPKAIEAIPGPSLTGPATVAIGQNAVAQHTGVQGHTIFVGYNFTTAPLIAPPYGIYWLGTYPPLGYSVPFATIPAGGFYNIPFTVPNFPWLVGQTIDTQSYEYDGFFGRLSELYRITII